MDKTAQIEAKIDELVALLHGSTLNKEQAQHLQQKINDAIALSSFPDKLEAFRELDKEQDRLELLDNLEVLLSQHQLDSKVSKQFLYRERFNKMLVAIIGIIMITLGMGMIIMPAPPYFEMFTLFYFNPNDGVTIMDVLSLLIVFAGVYLLSNAIMKKPNAENRLNGDDTQ